MAKKPTTQSTDRLLRSLLVLSRAVEELLGFQGAGRISLRDGVTSNMLRSLCFLDQQGDQTATRIARFLKVSPGAITQLADSLETSGMIRRLRTGKDRRVVYLSLTTPGREFVRFVRKDQRHVLQSAHRGMTSTNVDQWTATLDEISSALSGAERTFEDLCLQCGAYADGTCVLDGGSAACKFETQAPLPKRSRKTEVLSAIAPSKRKARASTKSGRRKR
jgi:DNA-binding MarR family transcriptional regulator